MGILLTVRNVDACDAQQNWLSNGSNLSTAGVDLIYRRGGPAGEPRWPGFLIPKDPARGVLSGRSRRIFFQSRSPSGQGGCLARP
jgi:hypothetical protein